MRIKKIRKYILGALCLAVLLPTLSGCFSTAADDLYSLPQASTEYIKLQEQINAVLATGAEYSPPTSGSNRQSVQLKDLDGDGINEAIAFFRTSGDKPLKIYIMKQTDDTYKTVNIIDGDGTAIESIRYADLDGDGVFELVVGWQMSAALLHMMIYSIRDNQHTVLADADYSKLVTSDLDGDGHTDVIALRLSSSDLPGRAEMFSLRSDGEIVRRPAALSNGLESITRIMKGKLSDGTPAIFVEGGYNGTSVITDIFSWQNDSLVNVAANPSSGVSEDTLRTYPVYSTDINKDGIMEIPAPRLLKSPSDTKYYVIDWFAYDRSGNKTEIFTTYHDFSDSWYMILPDDWKDAITIRRDDTVPGERTIIFSAVNSAGETPVDFLKIYTLSGDNKEDRAKLVGRFELQLQEHGETIYAAEILTTDVNLRIDKTMVLVGFQLLYSDWATGVM